MAYSKPIGTSHATCTTANCFNVTACCDHSNSVVVIINNKHYFICVHCNTIRTRKHCLRSCNAILPTIAVTGATSIETDNVLIRHTLSNIDTIALRNNLSNGSITRICEIQVSSRANSNIHQPVKLGNCTISILIARCTARTCNGPKCRASSCKEQTK